MVQELQETVKYILVKKDWAEKELPDRGADA